MGIKRPVRFVVGCLKLAIFCVTTQFALPDKADSVEFTVISAVLMGLLFGGAYYIVTGCEEDA